MKTFASKKDEKYYYNHQASEEEFLIWYKQQEHPQYESPSLTVDDVLLCYNKKEDALKVLLVQRDTNPYKNSWALPGGFVNPNESTEMSCIRETKEETGVLITLDQIQQLHAFSEPNRDPRGWVVTVSYLAFIGEEPLTAGDDAKTARWFDIRRENNRLFLTSENVQIILDLKTGESLGPDRLAFDHNLIIWTAFLQVLNRMEHDPKILQVLGDDFTITEARKVFAKFLGEDFKRIDHSNFKKAMLRYFVEIGERPVGIGRPSKIYRLDEQVLTKNKIEN
ncbi:NUDIX domain-containing protein [Enterococcus nangangensis]|uniref:NUDIX domain-containing protein n=1 Tax=Enterococcus nangangensis TaxID=2559926 RepID=UPI0010F7A697|nr:NUDIX domain-containing protein [Enterococcus nangangensis]